MKVRSALFEKILSQVREIHGEGSIPLHRPVFVGNEKAYLSTCIDSNFVSSAGARVSEFEQMIAEFTGSTYAVAIVNGTAALHMALLVAGVRCGDEVISQALTFVATCNALRYAGAQPVFVDVDQDTLGMSPTALGLWLEKHSEMRDGVCFNRGTGARIAGCVPMHTFGIPGRIEEILVICSQYGIAVIEDAAESLGSYVGKRHTGTFGCMATLSFNGNKVITTGGGGMIITDDQALASRAKHLSTTAKIPHAYEFIHDEVGYNYRLPNLNAALGCAQMEKLPGMLAIKSDIARRYGEFCNANDLAFVHPREGTVANHWLNAIVLDSRQERDAFLEHSNSRGVTTRPVWCLMQHLEMFKHCQHDGLANSIWLEDRLVNLPSSVPESMFGALS